MVGSKTMSAELNVSITSSKCILLLGAGASKPLGFPLMADFMEGVEGDLSALEVSLFANISALHADEAADGRDLEVVLDALARYKDFFDFMGNDPLLRGPLPQLDQVRSDVSALDRILRDAIFSVYGADPGEGVGSLYEPLFDSIHRAVNQPLIPVFTTNYDLTMETYGDHSSKDTVEVGFTRGMARSRWTPDRLHGLTPQGSGRTIALFKLHGSVSWYRSGDGVSHISIAQRDMAGYENCVIYPDGAKAGALEEPFRTSYEYLKRCLENAGCLVVIGYSFRDERLRDVLSQARRRNRKLRIIVVNGKQSQQEKKSIQQELGRCEFIDEYLEPSARRRSLPVYARRLRQLLSA